MIRKSILISLLIFVVIVQSCVQKVANNKPDNEQIVFDGIYFRLNDMEDQIIILRHQILTLQNDVLERTSLNLQNELTDDTDEQQITNNQKSEGINYHDSNQILFDNISSRLNNLESHIFYFRLVLIVLFILVVVAFFLYFKYKKRYTPTKKGISTEKDTTSSGKEDIKQPYNRLIENSSIALQSDFKKNYYPNTISYRKPNEISIINKVSLDDDISLLFNSREKREKRYNSDVDDIFLDVSTSVLERLTMGEKINLILEERGSPRTAMFILVKDSLYLNFYNYNETNELIKDKENIISMIYDINEGCLPGYIKNCSPSIVRQTDDRYIIKTKGKLKIHNI